MLTFYKGHVIVLLKDENLTAEITEQFSSSPLPTTAFASLEEGADVCIERAKALIDIYLSAASAPSPTPQAYTDSN